MKRRLVFAALAASVVATAAPADPSAQPKVVAFNASVRVEVDADGKPVKVEAPADLPQAIRAYIEKRVASWQYQPARANGTPAAAVTYVRVGACAIPAAGGYRMGLDFKGNGPALVNAGPWFMPPPRYPPEMQRRGAQGTYVVTYAILPDGTTKVASVKPSESTGNRYATAFRDALTEWIEGLHYQPEQVGGIAVATEMSFPVIFHLRNGNGGRESIRQELESRALASEECIAASMPGGPLPVATNSQVKVIPAPAG